MTDHAVEPVAISDEDIAEDIRALIRSYDPLKVSRLTIDIEVLHGVVRLSGYVNAKRSYRVLVDNVPTIPGVVAVDDSNLYDDESLLYAVAKLLPLGVRARVEDGEVSLLGTPSADIKMTDLVLDIAEIPGVAKVLDRTRRYPSNG
jgi:osmotically-inducible protein OsmY